MDLFHEITDAVALVRLKGGIEKQSKMFRRGERIYIPHSGGFLRVTSKLGDEYGTVNPSIKVLAFEADGVTLKGGLQPIFTGEALKAAA